MTDILLFNIINKHMIFMLAYYMSYKINNNSITFFSETNSTTSPFILTYN